MFRSVSDCRLLFLSLYGVPAYMRFCDDEHKLKTEQQHLIDVVWRHRDSHQDEVNERRLSAHEIIKRCYKLGLLQ